MPKQGESKRDTGNAFRNRFIETDVLGTAQHKTSSDVTVCEVEYPAGGTVLNTSILLQNVA